MCSKYYCAQCWQFAEYLNGSRLPLHLNSKRLCTLCGHLLPIFRAHLYGTSLQHNASTDHLPSRAYPRELIVIWFDPQHHWFIQGFVAVQLDNFTFRNVEFGWWYYVNFAFSAILAISAMAILISGLRTAQGMLRSQYGWVIGGISLPMLAAFAYIVLRNSLENAVYYNPWPISFLFTGVVVLWVLWRNRLLTLSPIAQVLVLNEIPEGIIIVNADGYVTDINHIARAIKRLPHHIGSRQRLEEIFPEVAAVNDGDSFTIYSAAAGRTMHFRRAIRPLYMHHVHIGTLNILYDITAQLSAQEAYRSVVEASLQGFGIFQNGYPVFINRVLAEIFGYTDEEFMKFGPNQILQLLHPTERKKFVLWQREILNGTLPGSRYEFRALKRTGEEFWAEVYVTKVRYQDEAALQVAIVDITNQKQAQQRAFEIALERERVNLLTTFVQDAAHEFRTPLTTIRTAAYLIQKIEDEDKRNQKLLQIEHQVERMTKLVNMLLKIVRLESASYTFIPISINKLVKHVSDQISSGSGTSTGSRIHSVLATGEPRVNGNFEILCDAIRNLIDNALRFSGPTNIVEVSVHVVETQVEILVKDQGSGIAEHLHQKIFETFWREDTVHTTPGLVWVCRLPARLPNYTAGRSSSPAA